MAAAGAELRHVSGEPPLQADEEAENAKIESMRIFFGPLPSRDHFRLLRVSRSAGGLQCYIEAFALNDLSTPAYLALSYAWDAAEEPEFTVPRRSGLQDEVEIWLYNQSGARERVKIKANLHDFFQQLLSSGFGHLYYWVDALCINQWSKEEKFEQIKQMGEIYSSAGRVVCWLGKAPSDNQTVIRLKDMILRLAEKFLSLRTSENVRKALGHITDPSSRECLEILDLPETTTIDDWMNLVLFYQRRWFFRVWTVQEKAMGAQKLLIILGGERIDNAHIVGAMYLIIFSPLQGHLIRLAQARYLDPNDRRPERLNILFPATHDRSVTLMSGSQLVQEQQAAFKIWISPEASPEKKIASVLFGLLMGMRLLKATKPEDRVFGLLGVVSKLSERYKQDKLEFEFNDREDVVEVFTKTMKCILNRTQSLNFLSGIQGRSSSKVDLSDAQRARAKEMDRLPSWVPDWTTPGSVPFIGALAYYFPNDVEKIDASRCVLLLEEPFFVLGRVLHTHAINIARVTHVGESYLEILQIGLTNTIQLLLEAIRLNGEENVLAFQKLLILHRLDEEDRLATKYGSLNNAFRLFWKWTIFLFIKKNVELDHSVSQYGDESLSLDQFTRSLSQCGSELLSLVETTRQHGNRSFPDSVEVFEHFKDCLASEIGQRPGESSNNDRMVADTADLEHILREAMQHRRPFLLDNGMLGLGPQDVHVGDTCRLLPHGARAPFIFRQAPKEDCESQEDTTRQILVGEAYVHQLIFGLFQVTQKEWEKIYII